MRLRRLCAPTGLSAGLIAGLCSSLLMTACVTSSPTLDGERWLPRNGGSAEAFDGLSSSDVSQLSLVATSLVAALVQLPETEPEKLTLQVSTPSTAFGNTVLRALEDAGYGIQQVVSDQGSHYVAYRRRLSETDAGPVTDFEISVGAVRLQREFVFDATGIYPSSLLNVNGSSASPRDILIDDRVFAEQGGDIRAFISGVRDEQSGKTRIEEVAVNDFDQLPEDRRTTSREWLNSVKQRHALSESEFEGSIDGSLERMRRTVLIFDSVDTRIMGAGNKQAVRLLARDTLPGDLFVITACTDADGRNEAARSRSIRVVEEFLGHGVPQASLRIAPCVRASYRHSTDDSPVPVEVVQHRKRADGKTR